MIPHWLRLISIFALVLGFAAAVMIMIDEVCHPQHMWIMNVVWPVVASFGTMLTIWAYFHYGWLTTMEAAMNAKNGGIEPSDKSVTPFPVMVGKSTLHCGEMAGNPAYTQLLLGLGFRSLSVSPGEILEIKNAIRSTSLQQAEDFARRILQLDTIQEIKECLRDEKASKQ